MEKLTWWVDYPTEGSPYLYLKVEGAKINGQVSISIKRFPKRPYLLMVSNQLKRHMGLLPHSHRVSHENRPE